MLLRRGQSANPIKFPRTGLPSSYASKDTKWLPRTAEFMSVTRAISGASFAEITRGPFCPETLSGSYCPVMVMFGYFASNPAISASSTAFRPAPSHKVSSYFLLPKSVLTSVGFVSLRELLAEPGPHAVRLPAINIAASAAPLLRIILFIGYLLASSSYAIDISLYCHHFSAAIKYICDIDYAHRTSFCGTRQPCITPMVALTSKSRYNTIDYAMQEIP